MRRTARLWVLVSLLLLGLLAPAGRASAARDHLPDLAMARLRHFRVADTEDGRLLLRFSAIIVNIGEGPFELRSRRPNRRSSWSVRQVIYDTDGESRTVRRSSVQLVYAGDGHDHWHVKDLEEYRLVPRDRGNPSSERLGQKVGFCFFDNYEFDLSLPDAPEDPMYGHRGCGTPNSLRLRNGLSVGWGDIYHRSLPGQYVDITGLPDGEYRLWATADQGKFFRESNENNNSTWVDLRIDADGVTILSRAPNP